MLFQIIRGLEVRIKFKLQKDTTDAIHLFFLANDLKDLVDTETKICYEQLAVLCQPWIDSDFICSGITVILCKFICWYFDCVK